MSVLSFMYDESKNITELIVRDYEKEMRIFDRHDGAVVGLFELILQKSGEIHFLLENNKLSSLDSLARIVFEHYIYLNYIIRNHTTKRGTAYIISIKLDENRLYKKLMGDNLSSSKIREFLNISKEDVNTELNKQRKRSGKERNYEDYVVELEKEYLNQFDWDTNNKLPRKWYNGNGKINNFKELCMYIGKEVEYELLYGILSRDVHGNQTFGVLQFEPGRLGITNLTSDRVLIENIISDCIFDISKNILSYYKLETELSEYKKRVRSKYMMYKKIGKL